MLWQITAQVCLGQTRSRPIADFIGWTMQVSLAVFSVLRGTAAGLLAVLYWTKSYIQWWQLTKPRVWTILLVQQINGGM